MSTYSLDGHAWMLSHAQRTRSYIDAVGQIVKPGDTVLDIGTGVGTWAMAACEAGARRIYAVDPSDVVAVGRELAEANHCADRVEFVQSRSTDLALREQVDVIVHELHGVLPMFGASLTSIIDARNRLLKPGGTMIPGRDTLWAAPVHAPELYAAHHRRRLDVGVALDPVNAVLTNHWLKRRISPSAIVEPPHAWAELDYTALDSPHVRGRTTWAITASHMIHGIALWFDAELADGVRFSNAPGTPGLPFGQAFFPWSRAVDLIAGDTLEIELVARFQSDDYLWYWAMLLRDRSGHVKARLQQSDFWRDTVPSAVLTRSAAEYVAAPNVDRAIDRLILDGFAADRTCHEIAVMLTAKYPESFADAADASTRVRALADTYELPITVGASSLSRDGNAE